MVSAVDIVPRLETNMSEAIKAARKTSFPKLCLFKHVLGNDLVERVVGFCFSLLVPCLFAHGCHPGT